jgi:D-alanyl-D-alanine carboxypeptidase (penicillin-binding protein 5/6)
MTRRVTAVTAVVAVVLALACAGFAPAGALAASKPGLSVPASYLIRSDGHVLWKHNSTKERRVASTIKMLNVLVVVDRADLDDMVTVPAKAARTPGIGLVKGEKLTVRQLLEMTLIASANDAAEALAIHIGGTEAAYVKLMNAKAKELGLTRTHAYDPHGLGKREHSTAHDLSVLAKHVMAVPVLRNIIHMRSFSIPVRGHGTISHGTTDALLGHYAGLFGVKTGFTDPAGYCFVGMAKRGKVTLTSVVLGGPTLTSRFSQTRKLLDWGFAGFKSERIVSADTTMGVVQVLGGLEPSVTVSVHPAHDKTAVVWTRTPRTRQLVLPLTVHAPIARDDQLGVVRIVQDGMTIASVALLADSAIATPAPAASVGSETPGSPSAAPRNSASICNRIGSLPRRAWAALVTTLHLASVGRLAAL